MNGNNPLALLISLAVCIIMIIAVWRIYKKAGEPGWACLIPIYNLFVLLRFSWKTVIFWLLLLSSVALSVGLTMYQQGSKLGMILTIVGGLLYIILAIMSMYYLAKSFGKGVGFTIGLLLLAPIFILILGFGSAQYVGNGYEIAKGRA